MSSIPDGPGLYGFEARQSDDDVKRDLELIHTTRASGACRRTASSWCSRNVAAGPASSRSSVSASASMVAVSGGAEGIVRG